MQFWRKGNWELRKPCYPIWLSLRVDTKIVQQLTVSSTPIDYADNVYTAIKRIVIDRGHEQARYSYLAAVYIKRGDYDTAPLNNCWLAFRRHVQIANPRGLATKTGTTGITQSGRDKSWQLSSQKGTLAHTKQAWRTLGVARAKAADPCRRSWRCREPPNIATTYKSCRNRSTFQDIRAAARITGRSDGRRMNVIGKKVKDSGSTGIIVRSSLVPMLENITASHGFKMTAGKALNPSPTACYRRRTGNICQG